MVREGAKWRLGTMKYAEVQVEVWKAVEGHGATAPEMEYSMDECVKDILLARTRTPASAASPSTSGPSSTPSTS